MDDIIYIGVAVVFFVLTWGLLKMCEVLQPKAAKNDNEKSGGTVWAYSISFQELSRLGSW
jgi:hypothetical protein